METDRLVIRKFQFEDLIDFTALICNKMSSEYSMYDEQFPTDAQSLKRLLLYFIGSDEFFAVELKAVKKVIGFASLNRIDEHTRNLGYCIHTDYQHQGFGSEVVIRMKQYAKDELKLDKLVAGTAAINKPSVHLLLHNGFKLVGEHQGSFVNDEKGDSILFKGYSFECML